MLEAVLRADTSQYDRSLSDADRRIHSTSGTAQKAFGIMRAAALTGGAGIAGGIGLALRAAGDFEQKLNVFQAVAGATGDQMKQVSRLAKQLGADTKLPGTSAKDAAEAMVELSKGGLDVKQSMKAAKGVLQLSAAAQIGNAEAATITARALNAFRLSGNKANKVADLLAATSNASTAEITDVAQAMQQASASAAQLGVPIEDLTTGIGLMANAGIAGSDAGTSLKTLMSRLVPQTNKAADAMWALGLATEDGKSKFFDANGQFIGMRASIDLLSKKTKGLSQEQRQQAFNTIFGSDSIRAANIVLAAGTKQWDAMKNATTGGGEAAELAAAQTKGFKGSMEAFKSSLETAAISFGLVLLPAATKAMNLLSSLISWISEKGLPGLKAFTGGLTGPDGMKSGFSAVKTFINDVFKPTVKGIVEVFTAVLAAVKRVLSEKREELKTIFEGIAAAAKVVATVFTEVIVPALKLVFAKGGPFDLAFGLAISIVAGVVTAVGKIAGAVRTAVNGVRDFWKGSGGEVFRAVFDAMADAIRPVVSAFTSIVDSVEWLIKNIGRIPKPGGGIWDVSGIDVIKRIGGGSETGKASPVAGVTPKLWDEIALGQGMGLTLSSGLRPGDPGDHGRGHAVDMSGPASAMATFAMAAMNRSGIKDVIYGGLPFWMDNGRRVSTWAGNEALRSDHFDHAHVSVFDQGGWLPPKSATLAINRTPYWEPVGPPQRTGPVVNVTVNGWVGNDQDIAQRIRAIFIKKVRMGVDLGFT